MTELVVQSPAARVDDVDRRIIALLQPDGRMPFSQIAAELGVSEGTIRQRYRKLVDSGVLQVVAVADPFKIGFESMAMIGISVGIDGERGIDGVARELARFPEVSYVVMSTGSFDLLVEVITQNHQEFATFLTEKLHRVEGVSRTETFMLLRVYKMNLGGWRMVQAREEVLRD
ncbi:MAG TPA: Lrp/AsnC family transcriptional regulator [Chloroflexota bacterium]|nr:Lrp/AsnC family transcriptional regulator [Chloroflexota bacterium]